MFRGLNVFWVGIVEMLVYAPLVPNGYMGKYSVFLSASFPRLHTALSGFDDGKVSIFFS